MGITTVKITYAIDQAGQNPRSGKLVATYTYNTTFTGTSRGQPITLIVPVTNGSLLMHDAKLEKMVLTP